MLKVDGIWIPSPSSMEWGLMDISAAESGRTDDTLMQKNRVGQKRKLNLRWNGTDWGTTAVILQAFNPEYVMVTYPDMMSGLFETRQFYVGDRTSMVAVWWINEKRMESVGFDIIER